MRRPTRPRYWPTRRGYYIQLDGRQILLAAGSEGGETLKAAWAKFHEVMLGRTAALEGDRAPCASLFAAHLRWAKANLAPDTVDVRQRFLQDFARYSGAKAAGDLKRHDVSAWLDTHPTWGPGTRRTAVSAVSAALGWAADEEILSRNPVAAARKAGGPVPGRVTLISGEQHARLVAWLSRRKNRDLALALEILFDTGARPGEVLGLTASDYRPDLRAFVLTKHKTARRTGKVRTLVLTKRLVPLVEVQIALRPAGPLFLGERGDRFTRKALHKRFKFARAKLGGFTDQTPYSYRHRFVTEWLRAGKPLSYLCELLGTSEAMIRRHYGHLGQHAADLRRMVDDFTGDE